MALSMLLSIIMAVSAGLGIGGNFGCGAGLNRSETQTLKGINPVQHSE
jgi:hypothetical protein